MRDAPRQGLAVGFFDGVHLGHRAILSGAERALTFRNHPLTVLAPSRAPRLVLSLDERLAAIRACGVREVVALDFTPALAALSPEAFAAQYLGGVDVVRCGANWRFGAGGSGDAGWLCAHGFGVVCAPYAVFGGEPVSSTRIRAALERGAIADANAMLGRPYARTGDVFRGKGEGAKIGFPTVNVRFAQEADAPRVELPRGVYEVACGGVRALANWGQAPTMGARAWPENVLEIHFPDGLPADMAARPTVSFHRFIRPERTFASVEALRAQIALDIRSLS